MIVMDECDGVSSSDRGGLGELLKIVKKTSIPVVCIANDRGNRKIQSLLNHSYDLKFNKPTVKDVQRRVQQIATKEGLTPDHAAIESLCEASGNDVRQVINILQLWSTT